MATPEAAITELSDIPQKKKPKNMTKKELEVELTYYRMKEKGIIGKCGQSTEGIRGYESSDRRDETRKYGI